MRRAAPLSAIVAAALAFAAAFGVGMATKSSSSPQTENSLAPPVAIQSPRASLPALEKAAPTPALKPRPAPPRRPKTPTATTPVAPTATAVSAPPAVHTTPPTTPTTGVVHNPGGSTSNGGSGVVHGGN